VSELIAIAHALATIDAELVKRALDQGVTILGKATCEMSCSIKVRTDLRASLTVPGPSRRSTGRYRTLTQTASAPEVPVQAVGRSLAAA
jgi:hypothetical protein